jgi:hypothetical protein
MKRLEESATKLADGGNVLSLGNCDRRREYSLRARSAHTIRVGPTFSTGKATDLMLPFVTECFSCSLLNCGKVRCVNTGYSERSNFVFISHLFQDIKQIRNTFLSEPFDHAIEINFG